MALERGLCELSRQRQPDQLPWAGARCQLSPQLRWSWLWGLARGQLTSLSSWCLACTMRIWVSRKEGEIECSHGLNSAPSLPLPQHPPLQDGPLFGNKVLAEVIKLSCGHTGLRWTPNPMTGVFIRRGEAHRDTGRGWGVARLEGCFSNPKDSKGCWSPGSWRRGRERSRPQGHQEGPPCPP